MAAKARDFLKNEKLWRMFFSWCFVFALSYHLGEGEMSMPTRTLFNIAGLYVAWRIFGERPKGDRRVGAAACACGCVCSAALVVGQSIYLTNGFRWLLASPEKIIRTVISLVGFAVFLTAFFAKLLSTAAGYAGLPLEEKKGGSVKKYLILWGTTLLAYVPCFLAFYPGMLAYDSKAQLRMAFSGFSSYTTHHPPLHTMILQACVWLGQKTGIEIIVIYGVIQMVLMSASLAFLMHYVLRKICSSRQALVILVIYYMLNPIIAIFSLEMTKDSYFLIVYALLTVALHAFVTEPESFREHPSRCVLFSLALLFTMLFRNNAFYVVIALLVLMLIFFGDKKTKLVAAAVFGAAIVIFKIINGPVYGALGIKDNGYHEMLAVPMQQIAMVYREKGDELDAETVEEIGKYIDLEKVVKDKYYNPRFYDRLKKAMDKEAVNSNIKDVLKLWAKLGVKCPKEYLRAFLALNLPYWYPDSKTIDDYAQRPYITTNPRKNAYYTVKTQSKLPMLLKAYRAVARYAALEPLPVVNALTSISIPIWLLLAVTAVLFVRRMYADMFTVLPSVLLWGTYMLGPVSNFRYIYPIFALYPFYIMLALRKKDAPPREMKKDEGLSEPALAEGDF